MKRAILFFATAILASQTMPVARAVSIGYYTTIDIYDRNAQRALPVYWHRGVAWVAGEPGNEYQITLRNRQDEDVLAIVSVDGVNVVTGETASPSQSGYVIDRGQAVDITGWRKSMHRTAAFYFTSLGDSYAARTGRPDNVGVIGVALFRRKEAVRQVAPPVSLSPSAPADMSGRLHAPRESAPAAPAESLSSGAGQRKERADAMAAPSYDRREPSLGTGHGRSETSYARQVEFERASRFPTERIEIRYDSYANLVARGVIPREHYGHRREPQAFPGPFVPDPWR